MTNRMSKPTATMEEARRQISQRLAAIIREGHLGIQVRFVQEGETSLIWVYTESEHEWKKRDDFALSPHLAEPLWDLLEGLSTQDYSDAWTCHRVEHRDRTEFELKFRRASLEPHITGDLESYLLGCLSHRHHDSGADSRRRIRFRKA